MTAEDKRELNMISLDTFTMHKENILDGVIDITIADLKLKLDGINNKIIELQALAKSSNEKYNESENSNEKIKIDYFDDYFALTFDASYYQNELLALFEMKIIYAYKHFEINLKELLNCAYPESSINDNYKWESIIKFLKLKSIQLKEISSFQEVNQLRILNNFLKHKDNFSDLIMSGSIPDFKERETITYEELELFYNRIKKYPNQLLETLANLISKDLYEFDYERLKKIAWGYAIRMDKNSALEFSKELLSHYS